MRTLTANPVQQLWITPPLSRLRRVICVAKLPFVAVLGALLQDLSHQHRRVLRLHGPDTHRFLQGTVSADVSKAERGRAVPAALLTVKAKIVSELVVLVQDDETVDLVVPADTFEGVESHLDRHIIMDEVTVSRREDVVVAAVWGEGLEEPTGELRWSCTHPVHGQLLVGTADVVADALSAVSDADDDAFSSHRVEVGAPGWGFEVTADRFPPEVGFVGAVSYDKGCYLGQEPLARIHARGQVNRVMVRVSIEGDAQVPAALAHADRPEAGTLTTAAGDQGLAVIRRSFAEAGQALTSQGVSLTVLSGPLGDDPGIGSRKS
ncbi:MAG: YgfZ/GcvT domain-containing protein [Nannocystales bacterium]